MPADHDCNKVLTVETDNDYNCRTKKHIDIFNDVIKNLKIKGEKFWDRDFPADTTSLIRDWNSNSKVINEIREEWKEFKWMRADKIFKSKTPGQADFAIFKGAIEPVDIKQGRLDDSFFLSALTAISENPQRIRKMFVTDKV